MKRFMCLILGAVMAFSTPAMTSLAKPVWPADTGIESEAGIVMDVDSGAVLFGQNIHVKKAPASITKLLTALVVIENSDFTDMVTFSNDAVYNVESGSGNKLALDEGDVLSVEDCLYVLLLQSSNQAANALAEHVAGSREKFVEMMNEKVAELGCENSNFANPSGLNDDNQYTTAYDMALIGIDAYKNEKLLAIGSAKSHKIAATKNNPNGVTFGMEHKLLITTDPNSGTYFPQAVAGKTGFTSIAGQTLVTYAKTDDRRLMCVTLKSTAVTHYKDSIALLSFGFDRFQNFNIAQNEPAPAEGTSITIGNNSYNLSDLSIDGSAAITLPKGAVFTDGTRTLVTELPTSHPKGAVGILAYTYDDRKVGQVYIISAQKAVSDETAIDVEETGVLDASAENGAQADAKEDGKKSKADKSVDDTKSKGITLKAVVAAFVILAVAALVCGGLFIYLKKREEERRMLAERKRRRLQRLEDMGYSQEEFDHLLKKRLEHSESASARVAERRPKRRK